MSALLVVCGYAQFHAALPMYLSRPGGLSPPALAAVFAANTGTVAVLAVPVAVAARRGSYPALIGTGAAIFASSWVLVAASGRASGAEAVAVACSAAVVMGVAETALAPALGPLLNDLAPQELRGRYNGADAMLVSVGSIVAPLLTAALYAGGSATFLFTVLVFGCMSVVPIVAASRPILTGGDRKAQRRPHSGAATAIRGY